jgi:hypothetical protein
LDCLDDGQREEIAALQEKKIAGGGVAKKVQNRLAIFPIVELDDLMPQIQKRLVEKFSAPHPGLVS